MIYWLSIQILLSAAPPAEGGASNVRKANSLERIVRLEYRIVNELPLTQDVRIFLAIPQTNERQEVFSVFPEPGWKEIARDRFGNLIAVYEENAVRPGEMRMRGWMASVRLHAAVFETLREPVRLKEEEISLYTRDAPNYDFRSPGIGKVRDSVVDPGMSDLEKTRAIFQHVIGRVKYLRDDRWDPAPVVLERGLGSCSEFNYALMALLRSAGIPCRYTGGLIITADNATRYDPKVHEDAVFHRWTEVFLPEYGWLPVDASRGSGAIARFDNYLNLWGRVPAGSLQLYRGDGGGESFLGWDYVGHARGEIGDALRRMAVAFWIDAPPGNLDGAVEAASALDLGSPTAELISTQLADPLKREVFFFMIGKLEERSYPALAEALRKARHPSAIYYSLLSEELRMPSPGLPALADDHLRAEILKNLGSGSESRGRFEYWWRKARPRISFDAAAGLFDLDDRNFSIH